MNSPLPCNLCGRNETTVLYETPPARADRQAKRYEITFYATGIPQRIVRCSHCGLIYADPRPTAQELEERYADMADERYLGEEKSRRITARSILATLARLHAPGRILDLGCATGFLLDEAQQHGWEPYGVEVSRWAISYARERYNLKNLVEGTLSAAHYPEGFFDAVILNDVLEHLTDPKGQLRDIHRIMKPDGIIFINTPDIGSFFSRALRRKWWSIKEAHLFYFTRASLRAMLDTTGFEIRIIRPHPWIFSLRYWVDCFKAYSPAAQRIFSFLLARRVIPNMLVRINFRDQIETFAAKRNGLHEP